LPKVLEVKLADKRLWNLFNFDTGARLQKKSEKKWLGENRYGRGKTYMQREPYRREYNPYTDLLLISD